MIEARRAHPVWPYELSTEGRIRSIGRTHTTRNRWGPMTRSVKPRVLKLFPGKDGYLGGNICVDGRRINFEVHRLVCETFHGVPDEGGELQVRHLDGDKANNRPGNLAWGTASENFWDSIVHGTRVMERDGYGRWRKRSA